MVKNEQAPKWEQGDRPSRRLLAHHAIRVRVPHVPIRGMRTQDRGYPVPARLLAGNPPVSIIVVTRECIVTGAGIALGFPSPMVVARASRPSGSGLTGCSPPNQPPSSHNRWVGAGDRAEITRVGKSAGEGGASCNLFTPRKPVTV